MKRRLAMGAAIVALALFAAPGARADETPAGAPSAAPSAPPPAPAEPVAPAEPPPAASKRTVWPWIIMGTGVALIITATVLEVNAVREDDKRESEEVKLTS